MVRSIQPPQVLQGELSLPGDKSIAHRALLLNSLAQGTARVTNFPQGQDTLATLACLRTLGIEAETAPGPDQSLEVVIYGHGPEGFQEGPDVLDAGNSGTTMRLLSGLLAGLPLYSVLTGDASLRQRPMGRIVQPLSQMGARIWGRAQGSLPPLALWGGDLHGIDYALPVASAQVKSALLLAGLNAAGPTTLQEPSPSRDHTERMLRAMGVPVVFGEAGYVRVEPAVPRAVDVDIPGDISSAAPWIVAALLHPQARVVLRNVGVNPTRTGILEVLERMGGRLWLERERVQGGEPVADIVAESSQLRATEIGGAIIPRLIDELPLLALAASAASGTTTIRDAAELRVKESDRIVSTISELSRLGARIEEQPDGMVIYGGHPPQGGPGKSHGDHRIAILLAVVGIVSPGGTVIEGEEVVGVSYRTFWGDLDQLCGLRNA